MIWLVLNSWQIAGCFHLTWNNLRTPGILTDDRLALLAQNLICPILTSFVVMLCRCCSWRKDWEDGWTNEWLDGDASISPPPPPNPAQDFWKRRKKGGMRQDWTGPRQASTTSNLSQYVLYCVHESGIFGGVYFVGKEDTHAFSISELWI